MARAGTPPTIQIREVNPRPDKPLKPRGAYIMATFHRTANGIAWLKITWLDLVKYSENPAPVCDECTNPLFGCNDVVLIPILNQAYCPECSEKVLSRMRRYPEDRPIEERREQFWLQYFGITEQKGISVWEAKARHEAGQDEFSAPEEGTLDAPAWMATKVYEALGVAVFVHNGKIVDLIVEVPND